MLESNGIRCGTYKGIVAGLMLGLNISGCGGAGDAGQK